MLTENEIRNALTEVKYPGYSRDILSFGLVKHIALKDGAVSVSLELTTPNPGVGEQIKAETERVLRAVPGVKLVHVELKQPQGAARTAPQSPWSQQNKVPGINHIVAVASG